MEVPASDWTEREERSDSGADRGDLPAILRFSHSSPSAADCPKKQPFDRKAAPTVRLSRFLF